MEETYSKLNSTQKIVVKLLQQLVYRPDTGYTALYSCFNNWLQSVPTRYWLHSLGTAYPTPTGYRVIRPSPFNSVLILGQVDSKYLQIWLQLTGYSDWLQSLQITRPVYRLYSLIFTKTGCRVITSTTGYRACRQGIQPCFTKTGYRVYPPSPFNSSDRCRSIYKNYFNRLAKYRPVAV